MALNTSEMKMQDDTKEKADDLDISMLQLLWLDVQHLGKIFYS